MINYREDILHGSESFPVAYYKLEPLHIRYHMAFHWHPEHEILYMKRGKLRLVLNQTEYTAVAGDLFFIQGGTFHSGVASDEAVYYCIVFDPSRMLPSAYEGYRDIMDLSCGNIQTDKYLGRGRGQLFDTVHAIIDEFEKENDKSTLGITGNLFVFLDRIVKEHSEMTALRSTEHSLKMLSVMRRVLYRIETEYASVLTLESLAETAHLSPNYFCRFFKKLTGRSPIDYLISYRIGMAEYMLKNSDKSITETAFSCGFCDVSNFIKCFKREKGISPKQYVLSLKKTDAAIKR